MTDPRPLLIGMNNPLSRDPEHAPEGCTGHRLWTMLHEACGASRAEYLRAFERRNVLSGRDWSLSAARAEAETLRPLLAGRTVLLLGRGVPAALRYPETEPLVWQTQGGLLYADDPARWCYVPHPSGLNRWYNEPSNRAALGRLLAELMTKEVVA